MAQLRQDYLEFEARNAEIIVIGPEGPRAFASYWEKERFSFVGLPDPGHEVADLYGQQVKLLKFGRMPALVIIDKQGDIVYRHYGDAMSDIPSNQDVLAVLDELNRRESAIAADAPATHHHFQ